MASRLPTGAGSLRLASAFMSTARIRRALHRGRAALSRADVAAAETAGRWALSRLPDPTVIQPTTINEPDRELLIAGLELVAQARRGLVDLAAAVHLHQQALNLLSAAPRTAERDREESIVLNRLGDTLRVLGRYADAEERHGEALALAEHLQPADVVLVASALNGLGSVFKDTRQFANAACTYHRALTLAEGDLGPDDPLIAGLLHNLADLDHAQQRYTVGEPKARRALQLRVLRDGPNSTGTAGDLAVLGALLLGQGRHAEAEAILRQSLAIWQHHFGAHHYEVAVVQHNLAALYRAAARPAGPNRPTNRSSTSNGASSAPSIRGDLPPRHSEDSGGAASRQLWVGRKPSSRFALSIDSRVSCSPTSPRTSTPG